MDDLTATLYNICVISSEDAIWESETDRSQEAKIRTTLST